MLSKIRQNQPHTSCSVKKFYRGKMQTQYPPFFWRGKLLLDSYGVDSRRETKKPDAIAAGFLLVIVFIQ